ncbi:hypothetical protein JL722_6437 [Aureococcus anophagefferens]|nr:hypothetical protein JL722_6437 [Aureococcus anophagefferens]
MRALWWLLGTVAAAIPNFPKQVVQYGRFRTASTLQYQSLCAIMHLVHGADGAVACHHLARVDARGVPLTAPGAARGDRHTYRPQPLPRLAAGEVAAAYKTHFRFDERNDRDVWVFATTNGTDDTGPLAALGYDVKLVQSTAELFDARRRGAAALFGLGDGALRQLHDYARYWDILRQCCGAQMSEDAQSSFMGLGDLVAYTFVGLIVAVFIFQLVDTAQTAKRKLVAKKND